jgi:hypothetical protein
MLRGFGGWVLLAAVVGLIWWGCAHKPDPHDLPPGDYVHVQCTRCHSLERICTLIRTKKVATWQIYVDMMEKKYNARFTPEGKQIIAQYLDNAAADQEICP